MSKLLNKCICALCFLYLPVSSADSIESVFKDAARYTVKIVTTIEFPFFNDDYGETFGAGFLVDKEKGWILTNRHVVGDAPSQVDVRFRDSGYFKAEKLYLDPQVDLALIRVPRESIPDDAIEAKLGCYEAPQMGNSVVIFGHPSGLNFTGTRGIVSGTTFVDGNEALQTDAPLNAGNSGGPLINIVSGKVVGVSEAVVDEENTEGLNLTVSIDHACKILSLIEADRDPSPPILPVVFLEYDADFPELIVARSFHSDESLLKPGDIIRRVKGSPDVIENIDQLKFALRGVEGTAHLVVQRGEQEMDVKLPVVTHPKLTDRKALAVSGMTLMNFDPVDKDMSDDPDKVYVVHTAEGSPSFNAWFEAWDSIYSINGNTISTIEDIYAELSPFNNTTQPVNVIVRVPAKRMNKRFNYHELTLEVRDLQFLEY